MSARTVPWVLKVGGRELAEGADLDRLGGIVAEAVRNGTPTVLVHGGGEEVSERARARGLSVERVAGQRVTDERMLEIVVEVLEREVNPRLVGALRAAGLDAVGLSGSSRGLLTVRPTPQLGFVGEPIAVDAARLRSLLAVGRVPVIAPLGTATDDRPYNVNADRAAGAIAAALRADLSILTNVPGVLDRSGARLATLEPAAVAAALADGTARDGMIPKLEAAAWAASSGGRSVWIGDLDGLAAARRGEPVGTVIRTSRAPLAEVPVRARRSPRAVA